jgi:hypothetical protein
MKIFNFILLLIITNSICYSQSSLEKDEVFNSYFELESNLKLPDNPKIGNIQQITYVNRDSLYIYTGKKKVYLFDVARNSLLELDISRLYPGLNNQPMLWVNALQNDQLYISYGYTGLLLDRDHNIIKYFDGNPRSYSRKFVGLNSNTYSSVIDGDKFSRPNDPNFHVETILLNGSTVKEVKRFAYDEYDNRMRFMQPKNRIINYGDSLIVIQSIHRPFAKGYDPISGKHLFTTTFTPSYYNGIDTTTSKSGPEGLQEKVSFVNRLEGKTVTRGLYRLNTDTFYMVHNIFSQENYKKGFRAFGIELYNTKGHRVLQEGEEIYIEEPVEGSYRSHSLNFIRPLFSSGDGYFLRCVPNNDTRKTENKFSSDGNPKIEIWKYND